MHRTERRFRPLPWCAAGLIFWIMTPGAFGQAPTISEILIQGSQLMSTPAVQSYLKTRVGDAYESDTVQEDARTLVGTKMFADVRVQVEQLPTGHVRVYYLLRDLPTTIAQLEYRGAKHYKDDELNLVTDLRVGAPLNPAKNKLACQAIIHKYNENGRPFAECHLLKGANRNDTEVLFQITEGPQVNVCDLRFAGNTFVGGDVLETHLNSSKKVLGLFGGDIDKERIEADVAKLKEYYRKFGFHDVDASYEVRYLPDGQNALLVFHVREGSRYRLKEQPIVVGVQPATAARLRQLCKSKPQDYYNGVELDRAARAMEDYLGEIGFDVHVQPIPVWSKDSPGFVTVQYEVDKRH